MASPLVLAIVIEMGRYTRNTLYKCIKACIYKEKCNTLTRKHIYLFSIFDDIQLVMSPAFLISGNIAILTYKFLKKIFNFSSVSPYFLNFLHLSVL